tara:strand:- start:1025 stop:1615 length:591 start_codon:yes stop_codon:yes gene_type:complete
MTTKKLLLLRHAEARSDSTNGTDKGRALSENGFMQAKKLGRYLEKFDLTPEFILTSDALRTRQTVGSLIDGMKKRPNIKQKESMMIYETDSIQLLDKIYEFPARSKIAMLVNHNPAIHNLSKFLAGDNRILGTEKDHAFIQEGYPPCTLSIFDCFIDTWQEFDPHLIRLYMVKNPDQMDPIEDEDDTETIHLEFGE